MQWYIWLLIVLIMIAAALAGVWLYLVKFKKKEFSHHDYVWVGPGEHPFKKKKDDDEK